MFALVKRIVVFIVLVFLSGCKQVPIKKTDQPDYNQLGELEARHYDIPLLIDAQPAWQWYNQPDDSRGDVMAYVSKTPYAQAIEFYKNEMERYGWEIIFFVHKQEAALLVQKPGKQALISLRPEKGALLICIFIIAEYYVQELESH